ncbi:heme-thiolate peroxidase [Athelia psychrophila]|uniref:Heme-thiolate peroxidase n=1 Tax=Athelia psychrophila TaxID=1759441 RepID=A0A165WDE0_9AGAM|nr:heme-thiolate peroxidase [Fibularhizoctonia sp. CBS 109695]
MRTSTVPIVGAGPPPPPQSDTSAKLVADAAHPFKPASSTDIRGPCPGLNTLASHGYLNRNGIVTPQEIVNAVQEGFNMDWDLATLVTWGAFLVDGNHLTNLMSIGQQSKETGTNPPGPATVGGLNTHGVFEGDASTTRGDFYFGDNHSFNETLFDVFLNKSAIYGGGKYNLSAAAEVRWARIQDSMARNPTFTFTTPRYFTAYAESAFPYRFFVDGRDTSASLNTTVARGFFQGTQFPEDFYRRNGTFGLSNIGADLEALAEAHPIEPGHNIGAGNYTLDPEDPGLGSGICYLYTKHVNITVPSLYPNPTGALKVALKENLVTFYKAIETANSCDQVFPYGK